MRVSLIFEDVRVEREWFITIVYKYNIFESGHRQIIQKEVFEQENSRITRDKIIRLRLNIFLEKNSESIRDNTMRRHHRTVINIWND